jgi:predicted enzyme related to lactoylglutathione lyase
MTNVPTIFRVALDVADLGQAMSFYETLLGIKGRPIRGSRAYFDCGAVILALLDPSPGGLQPEPNSEELYFSVGDLEQVYERASGLGCLSTEGLHGESGGQIVTRPWGDFSAGDGQPAAARSAATRGARLLGLSRLKERASPT